MRLESSRDLHRYFPDLDGFWDLKDLKNTENHIKAILSGDLVSPNKKDLELLSQLVRVYCLQDEMLLAREILSHSKEWLHKLSDQDKLRAEIRFHLEQGRYYNHAKIPKRAIEDFDRAWLKAETSDHKDLAIDAAYMLSITLPAKQGKVWRAYAIEIAESSTGAVYRSWLSLLYMMEAWSAFDAHQFDRALSLFQKSYEHADPLAFVGQLPYVRWGLARTLRAVGQVKEALEIQQEILLEQQRINRINGHVFLEIAECFLGLNEPEKAHPFYESAYNLLKEDKWYVDNYPHELARILKYSKKT